ncbi:MULTISPECIES: hypothetical protein [Bacillus cereus group]|uniref:Uncharacterized protein n=1 Tax=Bacillus thuringiensis TaxID=1428 RepID=A0A1C4GKW8_BACTU|nr:MULTISPECIES: hypothetical protein [Bacillus cereus group]SCC68849.1 Protein of unknown function [Bacillus thuringiensis]MCU5433676.1 hypothetical protein [Bacillus mobilis]MCU5594864.1 hypothetical protein [Bacillus mobilis]MCU5735492.1 hypothetical protein [Bacillus mobilis]MCU9559611.1 hypothetical protein [Bacillus mobilis]
MPRMTEASVGEHIVALYEERASQGHLQRASKSGKIPFSVYF